MDSPKLVAKFARAPPWASPPGLPAPPTPPRALFATNVLSLIWNDVSFAATAPPRPGAPKGAPALLAAPWAKLLIKVLPLIVAESKDMPRAPPAPSPPVPPLVPAPPTA